MSENRDLRVYLDGEPFTQGTGFRLSGRGDLNLYPDLFILQCRNLPKEGIFQLQNARQISVMSNGSRIASRQISGLPQALHFRHKKEKGYFHACAFTSSASASGRSRGPFFGMPVRCSGNAVSRTLL